MEQEATPILELLGFILFLGSITYILGAVYQIIILRKKKNSIWTIFLVVLLTRLISIISSYFIWAYWAFPFDVMFMFFFIPALIPELIFCPLIIRLFISKKKI